MVEYEIGSKKWIESVKSDARVICKTIIAKRLLQKTELSLDVITQITGISAGDIERANNNNVYSNYEFWHFNEPSIKETDIEKE